MKTKPVVIALLSTLGFTALTLSHAQVDEPRPVIMLTGYWAPTNEMLRPWSQNPAQNPRAWIGANWENSGYDVLSYFPEFPAGSGERGVGDFEVDWDDTKEDFKRITETIHPIAILSFGHGAGPWEIEINAPQVRASSDRDYKNTLPAQAIQDAVNASTRLRAWVDWNGNAGNYLCGYLSNMGAEYQSRHSNEQDPHRVIAQGFIHVNATHSVPEYQKAVEATLRATIQHLNSAR